MISFRTFNRSETEWNALLSALLSLMTVNNEQVALGQAPSFSILTGVGREKSEKKETGGRGHELSLAYQKCLHFSHFKYLLTHTHKNVHFNST